MQTMKYIFDAAYKCFLTDLYIFGYRFNFLSIFITVFIFSLIFSFIAKILE